MYQALYYLFTIIHWRGFWQLAVVFTTQTVATAISMLPLLVLLPMIRFTFEPFTGLGKYGEFLPTSVREFIENYLTTTSLPELIVASVSIAIVLQIAQGMINAVVGHYTNIFFVRKEVSLANQFFQKFLMFDYGKGSDSAVVLRKIQVGSKALVGAMQSVANLFNAVVTIAIPTVALVYIFPIPGLVGIGFMIGVSLLLRQVVMPHINRVASKQELYRVEEAASLADRFRAIKELKMMGRDTHLSDKFSEVAHIRAAKERALALALNFTNTLLGSLHYVSILVGFGLAVWMDYPAEKIGTFLITYALFSIRIGNAVSTAIGSGIALNIQGSEIEPSYQLFSDLNKETGVIEVDHSPIPFDKELRIENVSFSYPGASSKVLGDVTLRIKKGEFVAVVGRNGSGKTTLIDVIAGYQFPQSGNIYVDDKELTISNAQEWHSHVGYVVQKPHIIGANVLQNVTIGIPDDQVDMDKLYRAVAASKLDEVVADLDGGLEAHVEYDAKNISGGQAQRIAIARVLYNESELLILDEATKSVDPIVERDIMQGITTEWQNKSVLLITHRMETLRFADKIVMLEKGRIIAEGDFETLTETSPEFRELIGTA